MITAGLDAEPVKASRGVVLIPDTTLNAVMDREFDMIALPGGKGADHLDQDPRIRDLLQRMAAAGKHTAAICAAPKVLASAGLLDGKTATCYPGALDKAGLKDAEITGEAVEIDGKIATSRGPGTAMDFALALIELLAGKDRRDRVEAGLQRP